MVGGAVDERDGDLGHMNDLNVARWFGLDTGLPERAQEANAAGDACNRTCETIGSSQAGAVDAPSALEGIVDGDPSAASTSDTDEGDGEDPPAVLSRRSAHELSDCWERPPATLKHRTAPDPG